MKKPRPLQSGDVTVSRFQEHSLKMNGLDELLEHSLTPINVLRMIRSDIQLVLGLAHIQEENLNAFEFEIINLFESIIRKGQCPSKLAQLNTPLQILKVLSIKFPFDAVALQLDSPIEGKQVLHVRVFEGLIHATLSADNYQKEISELKNKLLQEGDRKESDFLEAKIKHLRNLKDQCLIDFQRILFNDAANQKENGAFRILEEQGKPLKLDQLIDNFK